jgi:hypothetical protein
MVTISAVPVSLSAVPVSLPVFAVVMPARPIHEFVSTGRNAVAIYPYLSRLRSRYLSLLSRERSRRRSLQRKLDRGLGIPLRTARTGRRPCFSHASNPAATPSLPFASCLHVQGTQNPPPFLGQPAGQFVRLESSAGQDAEEAP